jgi:hypothetical protein
MRYMGKKLECQVAGQNDPDPVGLGMGAMSKPAVWMVCSGLAVLTVTCVLASSVLSDSAVLHLTDQVARLQTLEKLELIVSVCLAQVILHAGIRWGVVRYYGGNALIFNVLVAFAVSILVVANASSMLAALAFIPLWSMYAVRAGLFFLACIVGIGLFALCRAENAAEWTWKGFFISYVSPLITVAFADQYTALKHALPPIRRVIGLLVGS